MTDSVDIARDVIAMEIEGLQALKDTLGDEFAVVVGLLRNTKGRIVVTGMGKSGHIARKIAATFSSTGAPAMFVHPGEASHGDLGMISPADIILALSKSGETGELGDLLAYASRFSIPVVSICGATPSTLAKVSSAALIMPEAKEACNETHAPTTSTTMMLATGDALAVALLRARGFTADDFHSFHPGGKLGAALRRVRDLMHGKDRLPLAQVDANIPEVIQLMSDGGFGCAGIVNPDGTLAGIITDGDLRRHLQQGFKATTARDAMTANPRTATPETLAGDVLALMSQNKITALFVVEDQKPVGIVHVHDCLHTGVL